MRVINFGSLNIDHVYSVERFVQSGETLASSDYQQLRCQTKLQATHSAAESTQKDHGSS